MENVSATEMKMCKTQRMRQRVDYLIEPQKRQILFYLVGSDIIKFNFLIIILGYNRNSKNELDLHKVGSKKQKIR